MRPSESAKSDTSSPSSSSSITSGPGNAAAARRPSSSSSARPADEDALACGEPVGLDHARRPRDRQRLGGRHAGGRHHVLREALRALDPGGLAPGPNTAMPAWRSSSATPATSGASGPITTRSTSRLRARPSRLSPSSARTGWQSPSSAMPGLPGRRVQLRERRCLGELPRERVLASARADDEDLHRAPSLLPLADRYRGTRRASRRRALSRRRAPASRCAAPVPTSVTGTSSARSTNST